MSDEHWSPGVLVVNLLSVGVNNKYGRTSSSHFVKYTVENLQGVPPSPVQVAVETFGRFMFLGYMQVYDDLRLAELRQWIYQNTVNFHQALLYLIVFRISIMWVFKVALGHFVCEYTTFLIGVNLPLLHPQRSVTDSVVSWQLIVLLNNTFKKFGCNQVHIPAAVNLMISEIPCA